MSSFKVDAMAGNVVFISGGGSGIGFGICEVLVAHGAKICMMGRTESKLQKACATLRKTLNAVCMYAQGDVRDFDSCARATQRCVDEFGQIDTLINCAAGNFMCAAEHLSSKGFQTVIDIDLVGTFNLSKAAFPYLKESPSALIVNITATLQYKALPFQIHAAAAKAGIDVVTQSLGVEWGSKFGIRCVGVAPGPIAGTEGGPTGRVFGSFMQQSGMTVDKTIPVGRWGETHDIGNTILFLATAGNYINATTVVVDGGEWHGTTAHFLKFDKPLYYVSKSQQKAKKKKQRKSKL